MILSERFIGGELAYYRALKKRIVLAGQDAKSLSIQEKGFAGECEYDRVFDEEGHGSVFVFRDFDSLRKGLYCGDCGRFELKTNHFYMTCQKCGKTEKKETHVLRAISDYKSLFLNDKLTKQRFMEFIDYKVSERTVFRLLNKYCNQITKGKWTYYEFRYRDFDEAYQVHEILNRYKDKITNRN